MVDLRSTVHLWFIIFPSTADGTQPDTRQVLHCGACYTPSLSVLLISGAWPAHSFEWKENRLTCVSYCEAGIVTRVWGALFSPPVLPPYGLHSLNVALFGAHVDWLQHSLSL